MRFVHVVIHARNDHRRHDLGKHVPHTEPLDQYVERERIEREVAERKNGPELTMIWENEITPASDGLFKPDCDALQQIYDELFVRIGG